MLHLSHHKVENVDDLTVQEFFFPLVVVDWHVCRLWCVIILVRMIVVRRLLESLLRKTLGKLDLLARVGGIVLFKQF